MGERWVKIRLFYTTINQYEDIEIEEIKTETLRITLVCEPHNTLTSEYCELIAIIPERLVQDLKNIWEEIKSEQDALRIADKLLTVAVEVEDNPYTRMEFDNYVLRIEIS